MNIKHAIRSLYGIAALAAAAVSLSALAVNFTTTPGGSFTAATISGGGLAQIYKLVYSSTPSTCDMSIQGNSPLQAFPAMEPTSLSLRNSRFPQRVGAPTPFACQ